MIFTITMSHGTVDLYWAIAKSCSVYFYQLGLLIGPTSSCDTPKTSASTRTHGD